MNSKVSNKLLLLPVLMFLGSHAAQLWQNELESVFVGSRSIRLFLSVATAVKQIPNLKRPSRVLT